MVRSVAISSTPAGTDFPVNFKFLHPSQPRRVSNEKAIEIMKMTNELNQHPLSKLFDLENDPRELNNLAALAEHAARVKNMRALCDR